MATSNPFDPTQAKGPLLDELTGSAYIDVKQVAQALPQIKHVSNNLEAIYTVSEFAPDIITILDNMPTITYVAENLEDFELITENIEELALVGANVDGILAAAPAALASELKAQEWAEKALNSPVEIGAYSSKHHATKAATSETNANTKAAEAAVSAANAASSASLITGASWAMLLAAQVDGARYVLKVQGYTGGIGAAPTAHVGEYLKSDGTYTATIGSAMDIRGPSGPGSGDMLSTANLSDLVSKPTAFANIKQAASDTATGVVEIATQAEMFTGTDALRVITPLLLRVIFPIGLVLEYAAAEAALPGFLFCYGQAVSRATYSLLFAKIGTTYGVGDNSTTFNLPDLRGRAIFGKDNMGGVAASRLTGQSGGILGTTLGGVGGAERHQITIAEMAAHFHTFGPKGGVYGANRQTYSDFRPGMGDSDWQSATLQVTTVGGDTPHNNLPPGIIMNRIIFAGA